MSIFSINKLKNTNKMGMSKPITKSFNEFENQSINIISKGTKIVGDIVSDGDLRFDGDLKGTIHVKGRLVIGASGSINGEISCLNVEISGLVEGKITASELLAMKETARVHGEILSGKLAVEPGSVFTGNCKMDSQVRNEQTKA